MKYSVNVTVVHYNDKEVFKTFLMSELHQCSSMHSHTAQRAFDYLREEDFPWLASIKAHNKSHVPLLLPARVF